MTTDTSTADLAEERPPVAKQAAPAKKEKKGEGAVLNVFSHGVLILWAFMVVIPLLWAVMASFKDDNSILSTPWALPDKLHFDNWSRAWTQAHMSDYFLNTILVVGGSLIGTLLLGSMAAYVLARFEFPGNRFIYYLFIGGMSFPIMLALVPLFYVMNNLSLLNTTHGLILVYIAYSLPFTVFFLTSFFRTLPTSVAEAAMIDGASHTRTFFQVMLPMARPGLISVGIFNFLGSGTSTCCRRSSTRTRTSGCSPRAGRARDQPGVQGRLVRPHGGPGDGDAAGARRVHRLPAPGRRGTHRGGAQIAVRHAPYPPRDRPSATRRQAVPCYVPLLRS